MATTKVLIQVCAPDGETQKYELLKTLRSDEALRLDENSVKEATIADHRFKEFSDELSLALTEVAWSSVMQNARSWPTRTHYEIKRNLSAAVDTEAVPEGTYVSLFAGFDVSGALRCSPSPSPRAIYIRFTLSSHSVLEFVLSVGQRAGLKPRLWRHELMDIDFQTSAFLRDSFALEDAVKKVLDYCLNPGSVSGRVPYGSVVAPPGFGKTHLFDLLVELFTGPQSRMRAASENRRLSLLKGVEPEQLGRIVPLIMSFNGTTAGSVEELDDCVAFAARLACRYVFGGVEIGQWTLFRQHWAAAAARMQVPPSMIDVRDMILEEERRHGNTTPLLLLLVDEIGKCRGHGQYLTHEPTELMKCVSELLVVNQTTAISTLAVFSALHPKLVLIATSNAPVLPQFHLKPATVSHDDVKSRLQKLHASHSLAASDLSAAIDYLLLLASGRWRTVEFLHQRLTQLKNERRLLKVLLDLRNEPAHNSSVTAFFNASTEQIIPFAVLARVVSSTPPLPADVKTMKEEMAWHRDQGRIVGTSAWLFDLAFRGLASNLVLDGDLIKHLVPQTTLAVVQAWCQWKGPHPLQMVLSDLLGVDPELAEESQSLVFEHFVARWVRARWEAAAMAPDSDRVCLLGPPGFSILPSSLLLADLANKGFVPAPHIEIEPVLSINKEVGLVCLDPGSKKLWGLNTKIAQSRVFLGSDHLRHGVVLVPGDSSDSAFDCVLLVYASMPPRPMLVFLEAQYSPPVDPQSAPEKCEADLAEDRGQKVAKLLTYRNKLFFKSGSDPSSGSSLGPVGQLGVREKDVLLVLLSMQGLASQSEAFFKHAASRSFEGRVLVCPDRRSFERDVGATFFSLALFHQKHRASAPAASASAASSAGDNSVN